MTLFVIYFFRDPKKNVPNKDNIILSPADGKITSVEISNTPSEIKSDNTTYKKISIFLSIFDIHINRVPATGKIIEIKYIPGKFFNATLEKSSKLNERNIIVMRLKNNTKIIFSQIAGLIARRIISNLSLGQNVVQGDKFGIIKFGSRMDIYIPSNYNFNVINGQKVIGGETILASVDKINQSINDE
tara:strand:+ start:456 stop:1016 length:561 start_codon:yes stop_codon:yes gene_type:complete